MTNTSPTPISILPMWVSCSTLPSARSTELRPSAPYKALVVQVKVSTLPDTTAAG